MYPGSYAYAYLVRFEHTVSELLIRVPVQSLAQWFLSNKLKNYGRYLPGTGSHHLRRLTKRKKGLLEELGVRSWECWLLVSYQVPYWDCELVSKLVCADIELTLFV